MASPSAADIQYLQAHPDLAPKFDAHFGANESLKYIQAAAQPPAAAPAPASTEQLPGVRPKINTSVDHNTGAVNVDATHASTIGDILKSIPGGIQDSINNTGNFLTDLTDAAGIPTVLSFGSSAPNGIIGLETGAEARARGQNPGFHVIGDSTTTAGRITRSVSDFVTSFVGAGKLLAPIKALAEGGRAAKTGMAMVQGGLADFLGFDPHQDRLSNLVQSVPGLQNPVTEYLASKPEDGNAEGRFKNALEGLGLGGLTEGLFAVVRGVRAARKAAAAGDMNAAAKEMEQAQEQANTVLQKPAEPAPKPVPETATAAVPEAPATAPEAAPAPAPAAKPSVDAGRPAVDPKAAKEAIDRSGATWGAELGADTKWFNSEKMIGPDAAKNAIGTLAEAYEPHLAKLVKTGTYTFDQMQQDAAKELGDVVGMGGDHLIVATRGHAKTIESSVAQMIAGKQLLQSLSRDIGDLSAKIDLDAGRYVSVSKDDEVKLLRMVAQAGELQSNIKAIQTTGARLTAAGRIATSDALSPELMNTAQLADALANAGDSAAVRKLAQRLKTVGGDPKAMLKMVQPGFWQKTRDITQSWYVNSLLSGPKTHIVNIASNTANSLWVPIERMMGGDVQGGASLLYGLGAHAVESLKLAARAFAKGESIIDPHVTKAEAGSVTPQQLAKTDPFAFMVNGANSLMHLPSRLIAAEDEFFRQANFRAYARMQAYKEATANGLTGAARVQAVENSVEKLADAASAGKAKENPAVARALQYGRESTFQQPLLPNTFGSSVLSFTSKHPLARLILPFVKTPVNIFRQAWARTPLINLAQKQLREDLMAGGERAVTARGKLATSGLVGLATTYLWSNGWITGSGPADQGQRDIMARQVDANGDPVWQPYSLRVTDPLTGRHSFVSYERMAPLSNVLGTLTDLLELSAQAPKNSTWDAQIEGLIGGAMYAMSKNWTNQSFLVNVTNLLDALTTKDTNVGKAQHFIEQFSAGFVPTGLKQGANLLGAGDPYMREINGVMDAIKNKIPGMSQSLPKKTSWLTGQPVKTPEGFLAPAELSPFTEATQSNDKVLNELVRIGYNERPPSNTIGNVKLTPQQYQRFLELHGTVKVGGQTMHDRLAQAMNSAEYKSHAAPGTGTTYDKDSYQYKMVQHIVGVYRQMAKNKLGSEFPELRQQIVLDQKNAANTRRGDLQAVEQLLNPK
jgi:hypothetical protein